MNKRTGTLLALAAYLTFGSATQAATKPQGNTKKPPPPPDYFPLVKDYWWKYESEATTGKSGYEMKVTDVEKQPDGTYIYDVHTEPQSKMPAATFDEKYVKPKGWVTVISAKNAGTGENVEYTEPRKVLENPPKETDTWTWTGAKWGKTESTENSKVEGVEEIEVPAGKFKAVKVSTDVVQGGMPMTKSYWYAPWIGLVQSQTESGGVKSTMRLVDYSFKKPKPEK